MTLFDYKARNRRGEAITGRLEGETATRVAEQLFNSGITPIDIVPAESSKQPVQNWRLRFWRRPVTLDELILFCRQFYTLAHAGVPILRGLKTLVETSRNPTLAEALQDISDDLQSGNDLASSLARHKEIFPSLFVSIVRVGESTGRLDEVFLQLAAYLELEKQTRDRIRAALRYPLMVVATIVIALIVINIWVIPAFADAFARFNTDLPWATRILISVSDFSVDWWKQIFAAVVVVLLLARFWIQSEEGNYTWSRIILKIPLVGDIIVKSILGRFARAMSLSIRSGVPLVQALTVISGAVGNAYIGERVLGMRDGIERGETIARTANASGLFTPLVIQMIAIGEETGAVDDLLQETADHYDREVQYELSRLTDAIEPIIIVIIGIMVLILALGVFLPMWDLSAAAKGR